LNNNTMIEDLKQRLYDCYGKATNSATKQVPNDNNFAVVPKDELIEVE